MKIKGYVNELKGDLLKTFKDCMKLIYNQAKSSDKEYTEEDLKEVSMLSFENGIETVLNNGASLHDWSILDFINQHKLSKNYLFGV